MVRTISNSSYIRVSCWLILITLLRVMPHIANVSLIGLATMLLTQARGTKQSVGILIIGLFISDIALATMSPYSMLGSWSIFTYSGVLLWVVAGIFAKQAQYSFSLTAHAFSACTLYWVWTNFGTWLCSGIYTHSISGLASCFIAGLPFLKAAISGSVAGSLSIETLTIIYKHCKAQKTLGLK